MPISTKSTGKPGGKRPAPYARKGLEAGTKEGVRAGGKAGGRGKKGGVAKRVGVEELGELDAQLSSILPHMGLTRRADKEKERRRVAEEKESKIQRWESEARSVDEAMGQLEGLLRGSD